MSKQIPPIVMLHHVSDDPSHASLKPYSISRKIFLQLLNYLDENNYETVGFDDLVAGYSSEQKKITLTFDDCPKHLFDFAIPELQKRKMKASFYMPTAHIGSYNSWDAEEGRTGVELMNEAELKELQRLGMEVGAHSHHHIKLKGINETTLRFEVTECKKILESITGKEVCSFAYPFGSVPKNYRAILSAAGYSYASSIYYPFENNLSLRRFIYHDGDTKKTLEQKLSFAYQCYRFFTDPLKRY